MKNKKVTVRCTS